MTSGRAEAAAQEPADRGAAEKGPAGRALMYVKGCPHALGCTMLLKGGPIAQLRRVKKVARVGMASISLTRCMSWIVVKPLMND